MWRLDSDVAISKAQFAKEMGLSARGINKMIARGDLPPVAFHVGRKGFWYRRKLEVYLVEREKRRLPGR